MSQNPAVVLDLGADQIKVGFSNSQCPSFILPNVSSTTESSGQHSSRKSKPSHQFLCCDGVIRTLNSGISLNPCYPIKKSNVINWNDQSKILDYIFSNKLKISLEDQQLMLTESPLTTRKQRKKAIELLFEQFKINSLNIQPESLCSLFGVGLTSGTVIEIGQNSTRIASIIDQKLVPKSCSHIKVGGADITDRLFNLFKLRQINSKEFVDISDFQLNETLRNFKANYCKVSKNIARRRKLYNSESCQYSTYTTKDGQTIQIQSEIYEPAEVLFDPSIVGGEGSGLISMLFNNIAQADNNPVTRRAISEHVVLSGATSLLPGLRERIENDIRQMIKEEITGTNDHNFTSNDSLHVDVVTHSNILAYAGASISAHIHLNSEDFWVTKTLYESEGSDAVVRKFKSATLCG